MRLSINIVKELLGNRIKKIKKDLTNHTDDSSTTRLKAEKPSDPQANK